MSPLMVQGIVAGVGALVIALLGYLTASTQAHTREIGDAKSLAAAAALAATARGGAVPDPVGAGGLVRAYPVWDQLRDPLPTGTLPGGRYDECGEECCSMVIQQQHGVEVSADALRAQLGGARRGPLTDGPDLVRILGRANVGAELHPWPPADAPGHVRASVAAGRGVIALGHWISPTVLHWVLITTADNNHAGYNDPWGGVRASMTWAQFGERYAGEMVTITRTADAA
jgi:hypothetical protein